MSMLMNGFMPASVLGMIVLFVALRTKAVKTVDIKLVSRALLDNMVLFFVPVGSGIMVSYALIGQHFWAIVISLLISTVLVIVGVGVLQQKIGRKQ